MTDNPICNRVKWIKITKAMPKANKYVLLSFWDKSVTIGEKLAYKSEKGKPIFLLSEGRECDPEEEGLLYWAKLPTAGKRYDTTDQ